MVKAEHRLCSPGFGRGGRHGAGSEPGGRKAVAGDGSWQARGYGFDGFFIKIVVFWSQ